jgi:hypothetical protein
MRKTKMLRLSLVGLAAFLGSCGTSHVSSAASSGPSSSPASSAVQSSTVSAASSEAKLSLSFKALSPLGAPALAYTSYLTDNKAQITTAAPSVVSAELMKGEYGAIIFDLTNGSKLISKKGAPYKLAKVLTKGNSYIVSTGHDANRKMEEGDAIVSFGTSAIFTGIMKKIYGITTVSEVSDVATAFSVAKTGKLEGNDVDYVLLSEPMVTKLLLSGSTDTVYANLTAEWASYSKAQGYNGGQGFTGFPQAGLFISDTLEADTAKKAEITSFLGEINKTAGDLISGDGSQTLARIQADSAAGIYDPSTVFGLDYATLSKVLDSKQNPNKTVNALAFNQEAYDVNAFFTEAGLTGYTALDSAVFSSFYQAA